MFRPIHEAISNIERMHLTHRGETDGTHASLYSMSNRIDSLYRSAEMDPQFHNKNNVYALRAYTTTKDGRLILSDSFYLDGDVFMTMKEAPETVRWPFGMLYERARTGNYPREYYTPNEPGQWYFMKKLDDGDVYQYTEDESKKRLVQKYDIVDRSRVL